jgi:cytochrome c-type biogenesis protein CcmH/NrfF
MRVRMRQTGGDPVTSIVGIILAKRRKYGGYIIHLGVAIMFIGFAGKCFEVERNFTLTPGESYAIRDYQITYERLEVDDTNSGHVTRWITHLSVSKDGHHIDDLAPEVRNYVKSEQPLHEVAVHTSLSPGDDFFEDLYLVFNSFEKETQLGSFTVFVNPLINWVWLGFGFLFLGTIFCVIREDWAESMSGRRKTRGGRGVEVALVLLAAGAVTFGLTTLANAQAEHQSAHQVSGSATAKNRGDDAQLMAPYRAKAVAAVQAAKPNLGPTSGEFQSAVQDQLEPIIESNRQLLKDLVCLCGCPRESLYHCKCGVAAGERGYILSLLATQDLWTAEGRVKAREVVIGKMMERHASPEEGAGTHVLMVVPDEGFNKLAWAFPYIALFGALALLFGVTRRWVRSGKEELATVAATVELQEDEDYSDILDDELRETD